MRYKDKILCTWKDPQSNLSITDMLYSGHLVIMETFSQNRQNKLMVKLSQKNSYIANTFIADNYYRRHKFLATCEKFKSSLPFWRVHPIFHRENENKLLFDFYLTHFSTFAFSESSVLSLFNELSIYSVGTNFRRIVQNMQNLRTLFPVKTTQKPLYSGHLGTTDTFFRKCRCSLQTVLTVVHISVKIIYKQVIVSSSGTNIMTLDMGKRSILRAKFSSDSNYIVSLTRKKLSVWNIAKRKLFWEVEDSNGFQVS